MVENYQKDRLQEFFRGALLFNVPLRDFVSFRVGGPAEVIAFPQDKEDLARLALFLREEQRPFFILGEGTNLVVRDRGFQGVVIKLSSGFNQIELEKRKGERVYVKGQAGVRLFQLIEFSLKYSLAGLESATGIPGSVGGALVMNAGAYGWEMKDSVHAITIFMPDGEVKHIGREALCFSYRKLDLPAGAIVLEAEFALQQGDKAAIAAHIRDTLAKRKKSQPLDLPSAGSVFKNPPGFYAARLIDEAGLKGYQIGGAGVSERHANFIVNRGSATAQDILDLIAFVQEKVFQEKGITLETEIRVVGEG